MIKIIGSPKTCNFLNKWADNLVIIVLEESLKDPKVPSIKELHAWFEAAEKSGIKITTISSHGPKLGSKLAKLGLL